MNITSWALKNRNTVLIFSIIIILGGVNAYVGLGKLKNPAFTIKEALVITEYPGASPLEVEKLVTDPLEKAVRKMGSLKHVKSTSEAGRSTLYVDIMGDEPPSAMPRIWTELRERIGDAQAALPPGAGTSEVIDHFGRSYGILLGMSGEGFSMSELRRHAEFAKKRLEGCEYAEGVEIFGIQPEQIVVEISHDGMADLPISLAGISAALRSQNEVVSYGHLNAGGNRIRIDPTGNLLTVADIENIVLSNPEGDGFLRLGDIADVRKEYLSPPEVLFRINGEPAIGIGVSTVPDGNTVVLGKAVKEEIGKLKESLPAGVEFSFVNFQADNVTKSINRFISALLEAILIVVVVLVVFLKWRSALVITNGLIFNICATFIIMSALGIDLQKISLAALIIALGMLVDDSVVVTDNMLTRMGGKGRTKTGAALDAAKATGWPQLVATFIAICSFLPMALAKSSMGEYMQSLTMVVGIALAVSWVQAMTVVPVVGSVLLKSVNEETDKDPYGSFLYRFYLRVLRPALAHRWITVGIVAGIFCLAYYGFNFIGYQMIAKADRPQFQVNYWLPEGTRIAKTSADMRELEKELLSWPEIKTVATTVGSGPLRFMLSFSPEQANVAYGNMIVNTDPKADVPELVNRTEKYIRETFPQASASAAQFISGGAPDYLIVARITGEDRAELRRLASQVEQIMRDSPDTVNVGLDWRNQVPVWQPDYFQPEGVMRGLSRREVAETMKWFTDGVTWDVYRGGEHLMPILVRTPAKEDHDLDELSSLIVQDSETGSGYPLGMVLSGKGIAMEDPIIKHYDRIRAIAAQCNPKEGVNVADLRVKLAETIKKEVDFPPGIELAWGGLYQMSQTYNQSLDAATPVSMVMMLLAIILLFNGVRNPLIILLSLPLCIVGVAMALLVSGQDMGYVPLLGIYALIGIFIRNAVILLQELDLGKEKQGADRFESVVQAALSRVRPVLITACCTAFGMIPLIWDPLFSSMASTMIGGLLVGTMITLIFVPVMYALFYRIKPPGKNQNEQTGPALSGPGAPSVDRGKS